MWHNDGQVMAYARCRCKPSCIGCGCPVKYDLLVHKLLHNCKFILVCKVCGGDVVPYLISKIPGIEYECRCGTTIHLHLSSHFEGCQFELCSICKIPRNSLLHRSAKVGCPNLNYGVYIAMARIWSMDTEIYDSYLQWLPNELVEDIQIIMTTRKNYIYDRPFKSYFPPYTPPFYNLARPVLANSLFSTPSFRCTMGKPHTPGVQNYTKYNFKKGLPYCTVDTIKFPSQLIFQFIKRCPECLRSNVTYSNLLLICFKKMRIICATCSSILF